MMAAGAPEEGPAAPPALPGPGAAPVDVEAPYPAATRNQAAPEPEGQDTKVLGGVMSERAEAWRDVGEAVGLATWGASTALDIALAVVLLNRGSTLWLGLLMLMALLAPLCATAALVLTRNNWLAVALRYVLGVLLMRGTAGLRFQCLARWRVAQTVVAWLGLAGVGLVGALVAIYLATCYSVTALLSVPVLDATLVLSSVPTLRRHILRPDLVFLESYRQARYAAVAVLQSLPAAVIAATLLAAHVAGTGVGVRYGAGALPQVGGMGSPVALQAPQHGPGRALLAGDPSGEAAYLRRLQQAGPQAAPPIAAAQPGVGAPTPAVGAVAAPVVPPDASPVVPVQPPRQGLDLAGLLVAAAQALAASTLRLGGQQEQQGQSQLQLTPLYTPGPTQQPEPSSQLAAAIIAQAQHAGSSAGGPGAAGPVNGGVGALGALSWRGVSAAVASTVPRWLLVLVLLASLANLATLSSLVVVACRAAGLPLLRHLPHIAKMRGGLRVLGPVAEEALAVMAGPDRETESSRCEGGCGDDDCSSDDGTGCGGGDDKGPTSGAPNLGAHCPGSTCCLSGRRLLISSAWHWGCPPEGPGPWLPLVPRYLLPTDAGWLGPGQMARLATLAFRFYGEAPGQPGSTNSPALDSVPPPPGSCSGPADGGPAVTALEVEHLGGAELGVVVPRGLAVLPHVKRLHLRWCELHGRAMAPLLGALAAHPSLADLTLERCQIDEATTKLLQQLVAPAPGTAPCARLRALRLVRCSLSVPAASALAEAVARAQGLRTFVFSGASIEPTGSRTIVAAAFARALRRSEGSLRHLTVGFSRGCPATAEALAAVVSEGAAPQGLRHVVLSRREVASRGLAAWAAALARAGNGGSMEAAPGAAPRSLTLRAVALGPNGASSARSVSAMLQPTVMAAQSRFGGDTPPVEGAAGDSTTQSAARHPRRPLSGARGANEPVQWVLTAEELPITLVVDADPDAALRGRWLDNLSRRLLQRSTGMGTGMGTGTVQHQARRVRDTVPQRDTRLMTSAAAVRESRAQVPPVASAQQGAGFMGGGLLAPASSGGGPLPATVEPPGVGCGSGVAAPGDASSGMPPRLVVLGSSDASDTAVCALKGLPLTTLDLAGLELGQRGSKLVTAALPQSSGLRFVDLSATGMGDDAAVALAASLAQCRHLETLMLECNCITDRGAQALAEALEAGACPALCHLSLGGNRFPLEWGTLLRLRNLASLRSGMWVQLLCPVAEAGRSAPWLVGKRGSTSAAEPAGASAPVEAAASSSRAGGSLASSPTVLSRLLSSQRTGKLWRRMSRRRARGDAEVAGGATVATTTTTGSSSDSSRGGSTDDSASAGSEELCGVCFDRPNSLHVVGCGHQLCIPCYRRVVAPAGVGVASAGAGPTCPFCRGRIDGFAYADAIHRAVAEHLGVAGSVGGVCGASLSIATAADG